MLSVFEHNTCFVTPTVVLSLSLGQCQCLKTGGPHLPPLSTLERDM
jgi:hypothetical protein